MRMNGSAAMVCFGLYALVSQRIVSCATANNEYVSPHYSLSETGDCVDGTRVWLYTPETTKPGGADVIVYLHGYLVVYPFLYRAHLEHLVKHARI